MHCGAREILPQGPHPCQDQAKHSRGEVNRPLKIVANVRRRVALQPRFRDLLHINPGCA